MKIQVRDEKGKPLGAIQIKVKDLDSKQAQKNQGSVWRKIENRLSRAISPTSTGNNTRKSETRTIEININLPSLRKWPGFKAMFARIRQTSRRSWLVTAGALALTIALILFVIPNHASKKVDAADGSLKKTSRPQLIRGNPSFKTVLPAGKTSGSLGGWARVSPPNRAPVYAYIDKLAAAQLNVSEQPLPPKFVADTDNQVAQLAQNFNATEKFSATGTTVYIATAQDGSQSVIFAKNELLILIRSDSTLSNNQWAGYINSLQ